MEGSACVEATDCTAGTWGDINTDDPQCTACTAPCLECATNADDCTKCYAWDDGDYGTKALLTADGGTGTCVADCGTGKWENHGGADPVCADCTGCAECGTSATDCTKCTYPPGDSP